MNITKHALLRRKFSNDASAKPNCTVQNSVSLYGAMSDTASLENHRPKPVVNNAANEQYDREAYLAILSPETRERLLSIREPK